MTWGSDLIAGPMNRVIATVQNGAGVLRFGGLKTGYRPSPFQIVERSDMLLPATTLLTRHRGNDPSLSTIGHHRRQAATSSQNNREERVGGPLQGIQGSLSTLLAHVVDARRYILKCLGSQRLRAARSSGSGTVAIPMAASLMPYGSTRVSAWTSAPQE